MILLDFHNRILEETIQQKIDSVGQITPDKRETLDITLADFDGVIFHVTTDEKNKGLINISLSWRCAADLRKNGAEEILKAVYGPLIQGTTETSYDITLRIDLDNLGAEKDKLAKKIGLLKRHLLAGPFRKTFDLVEKNTPPQPILIQWRDNESFYIKPQSDSVIVIFSMYFKDPDDQILAKIFLSQFQDARGAANSVPNVTFAQKDPPLELKGVKGITGGSQQGFVSFVLFKPHITGQNKDKTINIIQTFRDYLHYHIKCAKAYLHNRMRTRVDSLLQVLNRAKQEPIEPKEKKTITGRTFKQAGHATGPVPKGKGPATKK